MVRMIIKCNRYYGCSISGDFRGILPHFADCHLLSSSSEYGPCIGMTRLERWERAKSLGLNPPTEVCSVP